MEPNHGMHCVARLRDGFLPRQAISVYIYDVHNGKVAACENITLKDQDPAMYMEAPLELSPTAAQELIDSLWECGVRPSAGSGSVGQLAAVQYHLEDMRKLVFKRE